MSSEPNSGVRQSDATEQKDHHPPQLAPLQTSADQAESAPQERKLLHSSSGPILRPTVVESPQEQSSAHTYPLAPRNVSVATLDATASDPALPQDVHSGPSHVSHAGAENGRVHGILYSTNRHVSPNRPQTASGGPGVRPRTGESTVRPRTGDSTMRSLDWVVPAVRHTVEDRLAPTLNNAIKERDKLKMKAKTAKWSINIAAALQVFLGSMTTGLSAIGLDGKHFGVATTVLGILATLTGAFLARVRARDEPETSLIRAHDLDSFIRDCQAFRLDFGLDTGERYDNRIEEFRRRYEMILGNIRAEPARTGQREPPSQQDKATSSKQTSKQLQV